MKLFHDTTDQIADVIEREGFRDAPNGELAGVFCSDNRGSYGTATFEIDVPDELAAAHRIVVFLGEDCEMCSDVETCEHEDPDAPVEWIFPAATLNSLPHRRLQESP